MPWTTIDQLTHENGKLKTGKGSKDELGALYYFDDIKVVMNQQDFDELTELHVVFEREDINVTNRRDLTVLAGKTKSGTILNRVALPWPSYYERKSRHRGTVSFEGSDLYKPGEKLNK